MNRNIVLELFLIVSVASIWISGALATQQYMIAYNTTFSTNATCSVCHVNPAGGGTLTSYGMLFQNQTNHTTFPGAALQAIGRAPLTTPIATGTATSTATAIATSTAISTATATVITTPLPFNATLAPTETQMPVVTTPRITTPLPTPTPTPSTPGFGLGVLIAGLLACYFILKRRNNN